MERKWVKRRETEREETKEGTRETIDGTQQPTAPPQSTDKSRALEKMEKSREEGTAIPKTPRIMAQPGSAAPPSSAATPTSRPRVLVVYAPLPASQEERDFSEYLLRCVARTEQLVTEEGSARQNWRQRLQGMRKRKEAGEKQASPHSLSPPSSQPLSVPSSPPPPPPPLSNLISQSVTSQFGSQVVGHTPSHPAIPPSPPEHHLKLSSTAAKNHLPTGRMPLPNDPTTNHPLSPVTSTGGLNIEDTPKFHPPGEGGTANSGGETNPWATGGIVWDLTPVTPNKDEVIRM